MTRYISGNFKKTPSSGLTSERYKYLSPGDAEPNLGDPVAPGQSPPVGSQYQIVSVEGYPGQRFWVPVGGGLIPGSITVFDEGSLVGGLSSTTQINFTGLAVTVFGIRTGLPNPGIAVTVSVFAPGNTGELLFNNSNDFSTSSKLTFTSATGTLNAGDRLTVGAGGTVITTTGVGSVGIGTINPTQELHLQGDLRLTGTIYDYDNSAGSPSNVLAKNNFGGVSWVDQSTVRSGAGGAYQNVQFKNNVGLVDGAPNFVFDDINQRVGIGSTTPNVLLDVLGYSKFTGQTEINRLNVTGVATVTTLAVTGTTTTRNLQVTGITTLGFVTANNAYFSGIVTASKFVGSIDLTDLNVPGIATIRTLKVLGLTTTSDLTVYNTLNTNNLYVTGLGTFTNYLNVNNLNVTGVGTFDNIKLDTNTISTLSGNLLLDAAGGTVQVNDSVYVTSTVDSTSKDTGSILTEGGVGIEKNLYVGGATNLSVNGGITSTGGDLYVKGNLTIQGTSTYGTIVATGGSFSGYVTTKDFSATGLSTVSNLLVNNNVQINGIATVSNNAFFNGNVTLGDASTDRVTFRSLVGTGITPSSNNTFDLGGASNVWRNVYATTFNGAFQGNADTATKLQTPRAIDITGDVTGVGIGTLFDGSKDVSIDTVLSATGITPGTYGSSTQVGQFTVDSKGRLTGASNVDINFALATAATADRVGVGTTNGIGTYSITFVDSNNPATSRSYEYLYTDEGISFDPSINRLFVGYVKLGSIEDIYNSKGQPNEVITADGLGNWSWEPISGIPASQVSTGTTVGITSHYLTFVSRNNTPNRGNEDFYTDAEITYNPSTNTLIVPTLNAAQISTSLIPSETNRLNIGSTSRRWDTLYANTINADVIGKLTGSATSITVSLDSSNSSRYLMFSNTNTTGGITSAYVDTNLSYNPSTDLLSAGGITVTNLSATQVGSNLIPNSTFDLGSNANKWNNLYVNNIYGTVTGTLTGSATSFSVYSDSTTSPRYLIFSNTNTSGGITSAYIDNDLTYNPGDNILSAAKVKPTSILDTSNGTGSPNQVLTANGSGGWSWTSFTSIASTSVVKTVNYTVTAGTNGAVGHTTSYGSTGIVASIVPRYASSFMIVTAVIPTSIFNNTVNGYYGINYQLRRTVGLTTTVIATYPLINYLDIPTALGNPIRQFNNATVSMSIWEQPNTTSTIKYEIFGRCISTTTTAYSSAVAGVSVDSSGGNMFGGNPNSFEINNTAKSNLSILEFIP